MFGGSSVGRDGGRIKNPHAPMPIKACATAVAALVSFTFLLPAGDLAAAVPSPEVTAEARASTNAKKITVLRKRLVKLRTGATPLGPVRSLVTKLSRLNPRQAAVFLRIGLTKLAPVNADRHAKVVANQVVAIVKRSDTAAPQIKNIVIQVRRVVTRYFITPNPTPPPYQASNVRPAPVG